MVQKLLQNINLYHDVINIFGNNLIFYFIKEQTFKIIRIAFQEMEKPLLSKKGKIPIPIIKKIKSFILNDYFDDEAEEYFNFSKIPDFNKKVLLKLKNNVFRGNVITYKKLAELSGTNGAYRAVGTVMANNPFPMLFPCHRVIKSSMLLGAFAGSLEKGRNLKEKLLRLEGVTINTNGKILGVY